VTDDPITKKQDAKTRSQIWQEGRNELRRAFISQIESNIRSHGQEGFQQSGSYERWLYASEADAEALVLEIIFRYRQAGWTVQLDPQNQALTSREWVLTFK
jgi:hypothetical protein